MLAVSMPTPRMVRDESGIQQVGMRALENVSFEHHPGLVYRSSALYPAIVAPNQPHEDQCPVWNAAIT